MKDPIIFQRVFQH